MWWILLLLLLVSQETEAVQDVQVVDLEKVLDLVVELEAEEGVSEGEEGILGESQSNIEQNSKLIIRLRRQNDPAGEGEKTIQQQMNRLVAKQNGGRQISGENQNRGNQGRHENMRNDNGRNEWRSKGENLSLISYVIHLRWSL